MGGGPQRGHMDPAQDTGIEIHPNSTKDASDTIKVAGSPTSAARPQPSQELLAWTKALWKETDKPTNWEAAVKAAEYCQQTLFPSWYDIKDPGKGRMHSPLRRREDDRRVRIPMAFMNLQQAVAMLVPEGTESVWSAEEQVRKAEDMHSSIAANPTIDAFAQTMGIVLEEYQEEQQYGNVRKMWVRDALAFPIAWLKVYFSRSWKDSPVGRADSDDEQSNVARIADISQRILDGDIHPGDPEYLDLQKLVEGIGGKSELTLNQELVIERLEIEDVVIPDSVKSPDAILRSPWIAQNIWMAISELRQRYPYVDNGDGTWTGIHPDDMASLVGDPSNSIGSADRVKRNPHAVLADQSQKGEDKQVRVREVHSRENNSICVLVDGLSYPAHEWTPKRTPGQWYMFMPLVLNDVPRSAFGISDTELCAETQHRMNRKMSDGEKARWLSLRRYVRDTSTGDPKDSMNLMNIPPGSVGGMNLGGQGLEKTLFPVETPYNPAAFDISQDEKFGRMATRLPEQALGATGGGSADFSSEVDVAAQGATIAVRDRQQTIKMALGRFDRLCAEILLQELCWQDAADIAGPNAVWPHVYSEQEAKALHEGILAEVRQQIAPQVIQAYQTNPALLVGQDEASRTWEIMEAIDRACMPEVEKMCMGRFGVPEPLSREALFKRLRIEVHASTNADMDRKQRNQDLNNGLTAIAQLKLAFSQSGTPLEVRPLVQRIMGDMSQGDLDAMFPDDVNSSLKQTAQMIQQDPQSVDKQLLQQVAQMVAQLLGPSMPQQVPPGAPPTNGAQHGSPNGAPPASQPPPQQPAQSAPQQGQPQQ